MFLMTDEVKKKASKTTRDNKWDEKKKKINEIHEEAKNDFLERHDYFHKITEFLEIQISNTSLSQKKIFNAFE